MDKIFKKGDLIVKEGDTGTEAYRIISGKVEVFRFAKGNRIPLAVLAEGQIFGEMSMVDDRPRSAFIIALEDTKVMVFNRDEFNKLFYTKPDEVRIFIKKIFERLRNIDQSIIDMAMRTTAEAYYIGADVILSGSTKEAKKTLKDKQIKIKKYPFKVGRRTKSSERDIFTINDLYIEDEMPYNVSRNHFSIQYFRDKFLIIDRGSTLGTTVNGMNIGGSNRVHEIELKRKMKNTIVVGSSESPYIYEIFVP